MAAHIDFNRVRAVIVKNPDDARMRASARH
jgi:hypothetical protein